MPSGSAWTTYGPPDRSAAARARSAASGTRARAGAGRRRVRDGVVRVELDVALGADGEAEAAVLAELAEHVVEERDAGLHLDRAGAVEVELDEQLGFLGLAGHAADAGAGGKRHGLRSSLGA